MKTWSVKFPIFHNNIISEKLGVVGISFCFWAASGKFSEVEANGLAKKF